MNRRGFLGTLVGLFTSFACLDFVKTKSSSRLQNDNKPSICYDTVEVHPNGEIWYISYCFDKTPRFTTLEEALPEIQSHHTWCENPDLLICTEDKPIVSDMVMLTSVVFGKPEKTSLT